MQGAKTGWEREAQSCPRALGGRASVLALEGSGTIIPIGTVMPIGTGGSYDVVTLGSRGNGKKAQVFRDKREDGMGKQGKWRGERKGKECL